jgi:diaminopimelate decarboxylase
MASSIPPETPAYVLDRDALRHRFRALKEQSDCLLSYSVKTLPVAEALIDAYQANWYVEVVSAGEYEFAEKCGIPGENIILNGPLKSDSILSRTLKHGGLIHVDSLSELQRASKLFKTCSQRGRLGIRLGLGVTDPAWARFGIDVSDESQAIKQIVQTTKDVRVRSFHVHSGTNRTSIQDFLVIAGRAIRFAELYSRYVGESIEFIDLGGGFPDPLVPPIGAVNWNVPGLTAFFQAADKLLREMWGGKNIPSLIFEPGRALVGPFVDLYCSVEVVKDVAGTQVVTLDAGINSLPFARYFEYSIEVVKGSVDELVPTVLCGPLCMSDDILRYNGTLPPLKVGDILCFKGVGAYNLSMAFDFITPRAKLFLQERSIFKPSRQMFSSL